jgi:alpha-1,2-mannosyltransferase
LLAVTIVGLLSCTVPPLAWGHHWVWTVPLLAVTLDRAIRGAGASRWVWMASAAGIYLVAFMWFNALPYRSSLRLSPSYPTYVDAFNAAIEHMTRLDRLVVVAGHPVLFVTVALATIGMTTLLVGGTRHDRLRLHRDGPEEADEQP